MNLDLLNSLKLEEGTVLSQETIEAVIGIKFKEDPKNYNCKAMNLKPIVAALAESSPEWDENSSCYVVGYKNGLRIVPNNEVSFDAKRKTDSNYRQEQKLLYHCSHRNLSGLTEYEKEHLSATMGQLRMKLNACEKANRKFPLPKPEKEPVKYPLRSFKDRDRRFG